MELERPHPVPDVHIIDAIRLIPSPQTTSRSLSPPLQTFSVASRLSWSIVNSSNPFSTCRPRSFEAVPGPSRRATSLGMQCHVSAIVGLAASIVSTAMIIRITNLPSASSLVYLAAQIRQSREQLLRKSATARAASAAAHTQASANFNTLMEESTDVTRVFCAGLCHSGGLANQDRRL